MKAPENGRRKFPFVVLSIVLIMIGLLGMVSAKDNPSTWSIIIYFLGTIMFLGKILFLY